MYKKLIRYALICLVVLSNVTLAEWRPASAADAQPNWQLITPNYETTDTFVAAYSVHDFGATGDGVTDVTGIFQQLLDALGRLGGGTLFVPEGQYVIRGNLEVPKGVTIRGEWSKPVKGEPIKGTILMAYTGRGDEEAAPLITMLPSSGVRDLAIWYPEQLPDDITPYSPAILLGKPGYWGNDFANTKNITLVNAYSGVIFSRENGGAAPVINGIYGTPLSRGIEIDNIADVGRVDWVDFSPAYWAGSGLPNSPAPGSAYEKWIYENGTGIVMRRNDWSYTGFITIEGYNVGFLAATSVASGDSTPNGHNYGLHFINCKTGVKIAALNDVGIMFTNVRVEKSETGIAIDADNTGVVQLSGCDIDAATTAILAAVSPNSKILMQQCKINNGEVNIQGGAFVVSDSDFNNAAPQVIIDEEARANIIGNRFKEEAQIDNNSKYITIIDHTPTQVKKVPEFPEIAVQTHKPAREALYVVTKAPFHAKNDGTTDNTSAIQSALDQAAADGGGVVFLPPGTYKVLGNLNVPSGVELKGAVDNGTVPMGPGSTIDVYADRGNESGDPFMKLSPNSGIRGLVFNYPEQVAKTDISNIAPYPYLIQATGSDVYLVNIGMRAVYNGIDLFTHQADRHDVDFLAGHAFRNAIKVGGGTTDGRISNLQFNTIVFAAGNESKFGSWQNSPEGDSGFIYDYVASTLDFMILADVHNQILYNNFHFGSYKGMVLTSENGSGPSGRSLGLGIDGSTKTMVFEALGDQGFDFINTQLVSIGSSEETRYLETSSDFTAESTFFSVDIWGSPKYGMELDNGTLHFQLANIANAGELGFAKLDNGKLNMDTSVVATSKALLNSGKEGQLRVQSSILTPTSINFRNTASWSNILGNIPIVAPASSRNAAASSSEVKEEQSDPAVDTISEAGEPEAANTGNEPAGGGSPIMTITIVILAAIAAVTAAVLLYRRKLSSKN
ncbi:carbohydrate-binding protein [Paenibacillaceae bacterium]|nr:carbohydrate-binding protein [Paenibacillaceae bacterium]